MANDLDAVINQFRSLEEEVRRLNRHHHPVLPEKRQPQLVSFPWQSAFTLTVGPGKTFFADRDGMIRYVRAYRPAGDGLTTATIDVLLDDESLFNVNHPKPTVPPLAKLGPKRSPKKRLVGFSEGQGFTCVIDETGGGSGPLRITIHFLEIA